MKIDLKYHIDREALDEYTELIKKITLIKNKKAGNTGFLEMAEESLKENFLKFIIK